MKSKYSVCINREKRWEMQFFDCFNAATVCIITDRETGLTRAGFSRLNPKDKYPWDPSTGRKYALKHALENSLLPKYVRRLFWETFFKYHEKEDVWSRKS